MDLSNAETQHFRKYLKFHIDLNKYVKLSVVALNHLSSFSTEPQELSDLIAELIKDSGERWYPTNFVNPYDEISDTKHKLTESALARVYSSFEVFVDEITGGYSDYNVSNPVKVDSTELGAKALTLFAKLGWDICNIEYLIPVYHFYNLSRHCVVHRMGRANKELQELSNSSAFLDAMKNWPTVIPGNELSAPPTISKDGNIDLRPHHAITYSDVCYRLAIEINRLLIDMVGYEYIVRQVARERILNRDYLDWPPCKDSYHYLRYILQTEYKIKNVSFSKLREVLEEAGIRKKCFAKHAAMCV